MERAAKGNNRVDTAKSTVESFDAEWGGGPVPSQSKMELLQDQPRLAKLLEQLVEG
jgi:hypothetical protein